MWCPKCHAEYDEGYTICSDCSVHLVPFLEMPEEPPAYINAPIDEVLLTNAADVVKMSYLTSLLQEAGIPYRLAAEDAGQYLQIAYGANFYGTNIYVKSADWNEAAEILDSYVRKSAGQSADE